jgi:hypothetical protein
VTELTCNGKSIGRKPPGSRTFRYPIFTPRGTPRIGGGTFGGLGSFFTRQLEPAYLAR